MLFLSLNVNPICWAASRYHTEKDLTDRIVYFNGANSKLAGEFYA